MAKHAPQRVQSGNRAYPHSIRPTAIALAVAACFSGPVLANPTNPTVVHGAATFATAGNILNITNSHNAIINWGSFSIGVNELTKFIQPSALSAVLNRVTGQDPSAILGALQSNGKVFLLNPNGIVFGSGAQINVAGLVASTLNLSNDDFLSNRMRFTDGAGAGSVVNNGSITGGSVYLVGNAVTNNGLITSPGGEVVLAAGNSVELVNPGTPNLRVEVVAPDNEARNLGTISAEAGRIGIYAGLIKQGGTLSASSAVTEGGKILLKANRNTTLEAGSLTTASGTTGGTIAIQSGDTTLVSGTVEAKGSAGSGGTVQVLGNLVGLIDAASVDASGETGGGTVLVGGDYQGNNPGVQNAFRSYVGPQATIKADAITSGDGGRVIVWADDVTRFYGDISARGGAIGGNGGFAEVSGKQYLDYRGLVDLRAPNGSAGTLLLDPDEIVINNGGITNGSFDGAPFFANGGETSYIDWNVIVAQLGNSNAIIQTSGAYGGDIRIADDSPNLNSTFRLDLRAHNNIFVDGSISNTQAGDIWMQAGFNGSFYGSGGIALNAPITTLGQVILDSGGNISQNASGAISASALMASSVNGSVLLDTAINQVGTLAGQAVEQFSFRNSVPLTIGNVNGLNGVEVENFGGGDATININVTSGQLTVNSPVSARGGDGSEGQAGGNATITLASSSSMQINSSITADGGDGSNQFSSSAGAGGNATVNLTSGGGLTINANVQANGGSGGDGSSASGRGGDGVVNATVASTLDIAYGGGVVTGRGGWGGSSAYGGAGRGGDGKVMLSAVGSITVDGQVESYGGYGGDAYSSYGGLLGGNGGDAVVLLTSSGGGITVSNSVYAEGGEGGGAGGSGGVQGNGGNAAVGLISAGGITVNGSGSVDAEGGEGGYTWQLTGNGGTATVLLDSAGPIALSSSNPVSASGGDGGENGMGGDALILISSSAGITVNNGLVRAVGGETSTLGNSGKGGAAGLTMLAGGNIQMEGAGGSARGGDGATGGDATVLLVAGGNITVNDTYSNGLQAEVQGQTTQGLATVVLAAVGNLSLTNGAEIQSDGTVGLAGADILLNSATVEGDTGVSAGATGSLSLMNDSVLMSSGGSAFITTGGNVTVDDSGIVGNPDVFMTVGGVVNINNGGAVVAGAPTTIHLTFPMLLSGGYFINGIEGVVFDPLTGTGFMADGSPAILGTNLLVTYGGSTLSPTLNLPTNTLIVAMGESTKPPDPEKDKDLFEDIKDNEKDAPVCR